VLSKNGMDAMDHADAVTNDTAIMSDYAAEFAVQRGTNVHRMDRVEPEQLGELIGVDSVILCSDAEEAIPSRIANDHLTQAGRESMKDPRRHRTGFTCNPHFTSDVLEEPAQAGSRCAHRTAANNLASSIAQGNGRGVEVYVHAGIPH
jgi:hypothetical protein